MSYKRYQIPVRPAPNIAPHPSRFQVRVSRLRLASFLIREMIEYRGDRSIVLSRPCVYGVFSGPVGGFAPREQLCVGCLRCTVQYPEMVTVRPNAARLKLGDSFFTPDMVDTVLYEAATGQIPVRGAGYRGKFSGPGWDGMWTDMSEIVRPTRDGIHGREYISTTVDIGEVPAWITFDDDGRLLEGEVIGVSLPVPMLFDRVPSQVASRERNQILASAAEKVGTLSIQPWPTKVDNRSYIVPLLEPGQVGEFLSDGDGYPMVELGSWHADAFSRLRDRLRSRPILIRMPYSGPFPEALESGARCFHLTADYHGETESGFVLDAIRDVHQALVEQGLREQVTLLGSGGIIAAEHIPKAIICGLDAVALDTPLLVAWQGRMLGETSDPEATRWDMTDFPRAWGVQRIANLCASWRDQLLEILGAMGLREVRRLRGEVGRAMFQAQMEREAFEGIEGFEDGGSHERK